MPATLPSLCAVATPLLKNRDVPRERVTRGYLPHELGRGLVQHVVLHLSDSMPSDALNRMRREVETMQEDEAKIELANKIEAWSDAGYGCCALRTPRNAALLQSTLQYFHEVRYRLFAWTIMPNHAHILFQTHPDWPLDSVVTGWKKNSATQILKDQPNLPHPLWQREGWDRYTRNLRHYRKTLQYIHENPVKSGLVKKAEDWPWSTAKVWKEILG